MKECTISCAAIKALKVVGYAITAEEIYEVILRENFYEFKAKNPFSILKSTLRKHSMGVVQGKKAGKEYFRLDDNSKYSLL
jgi:hypothetical protein